MLKEIDIVKQLGSILKTNVRACKALNHFYVVQLGRIYLDMLNVYKVSPPVSSLPPFFFLTVRLGVGYVGKYNGSNNVERGAGDEAAADQEHARCQEGDA